MHRAADTAAGVRAGFTAPGAMDMAGATMLSHAGSIMHQRASPRACWRACSTDKRAGRDLLDLKTAKSEHLTSTVTAPKRRSRSFWPIYSHFAGHSIVISLDGSAVQHNPCASWRH